MVGVWGRVPRIPAQKLSLWGVSVQLCCWFCDHCLEAPIQARGGPVTQSFWLWALLPNKVRETLPTRVALFGRKAN